VGSKLFWLYDSSVTNGYQGAQAQQRFAVALGYAFNRAWDISATYTKLQYIPGTAPKFSDEPVFNTAGTVLHWKPNRVRDLAAGYSYTWASKAKGIGDAATYHQLHISQDYSISKRTDLYPLEAFQRADGRTLGKPTFTATGAVNRQINGTASIGDAFSLRRRPRGACSPPGQTSSTVSRDRGNSSRKT
jgi:predicted porin